MSNAGFSSIIQKKIWLIIVFAAFCSAAAAIVLFVAVPVQYQTTAKLYISNRLPDNATETTYSDLLASKGLVDNYGEIIKSEIFAEYILETTGISGITPHALSDMIETDAMKNSNVLSVKVRFSDAEAALTIIKSIPGILGDKSNAIADTAHITELNRRYEARPLVGIRLATVIGIFILGMVSAGAFLLFSQQGNTIIRTPEDVEKRLGMTVIGIIPEYRL